MNRLSTGIAQQRSIVAQLCLFFTLLFSPASQAEKIVSGTSEYFIEPAAHWVIPPTHTEPEIAPSEGGVGFRLINRQIHFDGENSHHYRHIIAKVNNRSGLNEVSEKKIEFDPAFERLVLHQITIHRGEQRIEALRTARIETSRSENSFSQSMFEGTAQVLIVMRDIRVGDHVEYSYTIEGSNPVFGDGFSDAKWTEWSVAVGLSELRLSVPKHRTIHFQNDRLPEPDVSDTSTHKHWYWRWDEIQARTYVESTPSWYDDTPMMQASSYANWAEVAQWGERLFDHSSVDHPRLKTVLATMDESKDDYERIRHALDFVQNEIRYFGLELGENSHRPHSTQEVLDAGYGDCKDKTLLLVNLLEHAGIKATPALVHSRTGPVLDTRIPSPMWFNHVITHVQIGEDTLWLDATIDSQRGDVRTRSSAHFEHALLLKPGTTELAAVEPLDSDIIHVDVQETVELGYPSDKASMRVESTYSDFSATNIRRKLLSQGKKSLEKDFRDYTRSLYRKASTHTPMKIVEHPTENRLTIIEHYAISDRAEWTEDNAMEFGAYAFGLFGQLPELNDLDRHQPQALNQPINLRHRATYRYPVRMVYDGNPPEHVAELSMPGIKFSRFESSVGDRIWLDSLLKINKDHINAKDFSEYAKFKEEFDAETTPSYGFAIDMAKQRESIKKQLMSALELTAKQEVVQ